MEKRFPKVRFIIDPEASPKDRTSEITEAIKRVFFSVDGFYEIRVIRPNDDAVTLAKEARYKNYTGVVVCGGDTKVREASLALVESDTALGIVPIGERNTISDSFGISRDITRALGSIKDSNLRSIDVGRIADRYFFVSAGLGFDVSLSGYVGSADKAAGNRGIVKYLSSLLIDFRKFSPIPLVIKVNEKTLISAPLLARFALKDFGASGAGPRAGISLNIVPQIKFSQAARKMKSLLCGAFEGIEGFRNIPASGTLEIERTTSGPLHVDGELFLAGTKFEVSLLKNALKVWQGSGTNVPHAPDLKTV